MSSISNLRKLFIVIFVMSFVFCSSDNKKDSNANSNDNKSTSNESAEPKDPNFKSSRILELPPDNPDENAKAPQAPSIDTNVALMREYNEKLKSVRYPDGSTIEGFEYKKWEIPNRQDFVKWIKASGNLIKEALDKLPETMKVEIVGHADTSGPEDREGSKLGNIYYSNKRAESVKNSLVKLGFPEKRMLTKGLGSSDPIPGIEGTSAKNRRVTFKIVNESPTSDGDEIDK